jgi:glycerol kinase
MNVGDQVVESTEGLVPTVAYQLAGQPPHYALEGSIAVAGSLVQWLRDSLDMIASAPQVETMARSVEDNGGCYVVPAFSGLFAPRWRADARGVIVGLTSYVDKGHLARAVLEATGFQTRDVVNAMDADSGQRLTRLKVDGGMTANYLLMQFLADVLDVPVERPMVSETVSLGAAYVAGLTAGFWADLETLRKNWHLAARWEPRMDAARRERETRQWDRAVERAYGWSPG